MIGDVLGWLNERRPDLRPGAPALVSGIVCSLYRNSSKVVLVLFDEQGRPGAVVKAARRASAEESLHKEYAVLQRFEELGFHEACCAPTPLALDRIAGRLVLVETAVSGEPMTVRYYHPGHTADRARVARDFRAAERWLARFQASTAADCAELDAATIEQWVDDTVSRYRALVGWSAEEEDLFDAVVRRAFACRGSSIPLAARHGDFWMGNLLMVGGDIAGVLDWEQARWPALPFDDIFKFPTSYGSYLDRPYPGRDSVPGHPGWHQAREYWGWFGDWPNLTGITYSYFGRGWFPTAVRRFIEARLDALDISRRLTAVFFPLFLAEQAMTLDDPVFREGYRSALLAFSAERESTWLWNAGDLEPTGRTLEGRVP